MKLCSYIDWSIAQAFSPDIPQYVVYAMIFRQWVGRLFHHDNCVFCWKGKMCPYLWL